MRMTSFPASGIPIVFCRLCGCYGQTRFAKLRQVCTGRPTAATTTMHKRLMRGVHPLTQVQLRPHVAWRPVTSLSGLDLPRQVRPTAAAGPPQDHAAGAGGHDLEQQLDVLAGYERQFVHFVQAEQDTSDEDVFAHSSGFDSP
jgi:hypothetical protein